MSNSDECVFCKIVRGEIPSEKIHEDEETLAFMDIMPINKGHLLIIPKNHYETILEIDPELYGHMGAVISKLSRAVKTALNPDGMNVMQLNGKAANQVVPHVHMHLVPRWEGDGHTVCSWTPVMGDQEEVKETANKIRQRL